MKPSNLIPFLFAILFAACTSTENKKAVTEAEAPTPPTTYQFPPITPGLVDANDSDFGNVIDLNGQAAVTDHIFRVSETQMFANPNALIVKNRGDKNLFMALSIPNFKLIKEFGPLGKGPDEFMYPTLVRTAQSNPLSYVYSNNKLYTLSHSLELTLSPIAPPKLNYSGELQMYAFSDSLFFYIDNTPKGKAIFRYSIQRDTATVEEVYNLSFSNKHRTWASYIGDFGANAEKDRLVYAYKYFKRLVFMDSSGESVRTIQFGNNETKAGDAVAALGPDNVTHYWGMSAQANYVYVLYSGRTPIDVGRELNKSAGYMHVEQFDWNGNLIRKYKLNHWGYFCVNDQEDKIIQFSVTEENPIVVYDLPKL